jgi:phytoene desaturase
MPVSGSQQVVVVGAGFGGLSSALALRASGYAVTVVERHAQVGGKAAQATVNGVTFDTGPSLLTMPDVLTTVERVSGVDIWNRIQLRRLSPAFEYLWADGTRLDVHHEFESTLSSIRSVLGASAANELAEFHRYAKAIWDTSAPHFVYGDAPSVRGLVTKDLVTLLSMGKIDAQRSMLTSIQRRVSNPYLRDLLIRYATYNGSDVRCAPATLNCIAHVELGQGGYGVVGGLYSVVRALFDAAVELGVTFRLGESVTALDIQSRKVRGVILEGGQRILADAVVCNADVAHLFRRLLPDGEARANAIRRDASMSGYTFVVKAKHRSTRRPHTVLFGRPYLAEFEAIFDHGSIPEMPTLYVCDQALSHSRTGWVDGVPLFVMINTPAADHLRTSQDWSAVRDMSVRRLAAAGVCEPDALVVWERTPGGLEQHFPDSGGSIYGQSSNSVLAAFRRPSNRVPEYDGLYLASGGAHPGGGVPLCMLSGLAAARSLDADLAKGSTWKDQVKRFTFGRR